MTYGEKLKDPRWQKKRLEILERDEWTCRLCDDTETTLHIHHKFYEYNKDPWDYNNEYLITLCADCHKSEELNIKEYSKLLIDTLKKSEFMADEWRELSQAINCAKYSYPPFVIATLITQLLNKPHLQEIIFNQMVNK